MHRWWESVTTVQWLLQHIPKILNEGLDFVEANQCVKIMCHASWAILSQWELTLSSWKKEKVREEEIRWQTNQIIQDELISFFGLVVLLNRDLTDCSNLRSICLVKSSWRLSSGSVFPSNKSNFTFHICKFVSVIYLKMKQSLYMHYVVPSYQVASYYHYYHHCYYCALKCNRIYFNFTSLSKRNLYTQVCYMCSNPLFTIVVLNCSSITK